MFFSVLLFVTGIIAVQQLPVLPDTIWTFTILLITLVSLFFRYWRLMLLTSGCLWAICHAHIRLADTLPDELEGQPMLVQGKVIGLPQYDERSVRFDFAITKANNEMPDKIRLSWYFPEQQVKAGQHWRLKVKLKKPHGRYNPSGFDYERWLFMKNIGATGYVRNKPAAQLIEQDTIWLNIDVLRQQISDKLTGIAGQTESFGLIKALILGERGRITDRQWEVFRNTGTVHLLAISGLHIGLVFGFTYVLVLKAVCRLTVDSPQLYAVIFSLMIAFFYSALAGFSLPTQRALLMLTVAMAGIIWQRNIPVLTILAWAMLLVVIIDPLSVLSASFWLSFFAVVLIVYSLAARLGKASYWGGVLKIHWVTALGLAPLLLFYFMQVSIIAPAANLISVPVVSLLVVPICLIAVILMFVLPAIAEQLLLLVNEILVLLSMLLSAISDLPYTSVSFSGMTVYSLFFAIIGVFIILLPKGLPARWLGLVFFIPMINVNQQKLAPGHVSMTVLDVGQGLSAVIQTSNHVLVFDAGARYSKQFDMGDAVVIPFLKRSGISNIDTLLISHGDNDHIGGAVSVLEQIPVEKILTSIPYMLESYSPVLCLAGQTWVWDQVNFEILSPAKPGLINNNNQSCVLKINSKYGNILLTGDIEAETENWLVNRYTSGLKSKVLIAPHHGSKTSSTLSFLNTVKPEIIIIPSGYRNRYSFPHHEVLQRYQHVNANWFNTASKGAVTVDLKDKPLQVYSARDRRSKYWNK